MGFQLTHPLCRKAHIQLTSEETYALKQSSDILCRVQSSGDKASGRRFPEASVLIQSGCNRRFHVHAHEVLSPARIGKGLFPLRVRWRASRNIRHIWVYGSEIQIKWNMFLVLRFCARLKIYSNPCSIAREWGERGKKGYVWEKICERQRPTATGFSMHVLGRRKYDPHQLESSPFADTQHKETWKIQRQQTCGLCSRGFMGL